MLAGVVSATGIPGPGPALLADAPTVVRVILRRLGRRGLPSRSYASTSSSRNALPDGLTSVRLPHRPEGRRTGGQSGSRTPVPRGRSENCERCAVMTNETPALGICLEEYEYPYPVQFFSPQ